MSARWYAIALLVAPLSVFPTLLVLSVFSLAFIPGILTAGDKVSLVLFAVAVGLVNPWIEELGWTGFAVPELGKRYSILANGLIVGIMWAAWHFLSNLWGGLITNTSTGSLHARNLVFIPSTLQSTDGVGL